VAAKHDFTLYWNNLITYEGCPQCFLWNRGWGDIDVGGGPGRKKPKPVKKSAHHKIMGLVIQSAVETFYNEELWRKPEGLKHRLVRMTKAAFTQELAKHYVDWRQAPGQAEMVRVCCDGVLGYMRTMKYLRFLGSYARAEVNLRGWIDKRNPLGGYADVIIRREDTGITILDGKNSTTKGKYVDPDQLRFYALCFYLAYNAMPDRLAFVWYRYPYDGKDETGVEWIEFTKRDLQTLAKRALEARQKMNKEEFDATPNSATCRFCDYETVCPERKAMREADPRSRPRVSLPTVDEATGFVEFDLNSPVHSTSRSGK